jgi:hypothetical protein
MLEEEGRFTFGPGWRNRVLLVFGIPPHHQIIAPSEIEERELAIEGDKHHPWHLLREL